jgi:hypothetical protein
MGLARPCPPTPRIARCAIPLRTVTPLAPRARQQAPAGQPPPCKPARKTTCPSSPPPNLRGRDFYEALIVRIAISPRRATRFQRQARCCSQPHGDNPCSGRRSTLPAQRLARRSPIHPLPNEAYAMTRNPSPISLWLRQRIATEAVPGTCRGAATARAPWTCRADLGTAFTAPRAEPTNVDGAASLRWCWQRTRRKQPL